MSESPWAGSRRLASRLTFVSVPSPRLGGLLLGGLLLGGCAGDGGDRADAAAAWVEAPAETASPAGPGSGEPNLFATRDGRVYLSWLEPTRSGRHALRFSTWADSGWSAPKTVAEGADWFVNWADFPSLSVLPDGVLAAHWLRRSGGAPYAYDVELSFSRDGGGTWTAPISPHRDGTPTEHGFVSLFPWADGRLAAAWLDGRGMPEGGGMSLRFAVIAPDGAVADTAVLDALTCDCCQTDAAITSSGPVVVYRDRSEEEVRDIAVVRWLDGAWSPPAPVARDDWHINACPVNGPAIAADGGRVAVAWFTAASDTARVRLAFSDDAGASFDVPIRVDNGEPLGRVDVLLLDDGAAVVAWLEASGEGAEVRVRRVERGGAASASAPVAATAAERAAGFPRLARSRGRIFFAWTEPGATSRVRVATALTGGGM